MARKDYIAISNIIRLLECEGHLTVKGRERLVTLLCVMFKQDNKRFNSMAFTMACDINE